MMAHQRKFYYYYEMCDWSQGLCCLYVVYLGNVHRHLDEVGVASIRLQRIREGKFARKDNVILLR